MKKPDPGYSFKNILSSIVFVLVVLTASYGQSFSKNVTIVIDHGALHCPFLGPKMQQVFSVVDTTQGMSIDKLKSTATYTVLPDSRWANSDFIKWAIIHLVGYPEKEIKSIEII